MTRPPRYRRHLLVGAILVLMVVATRAVAAAEPPPADKLPSADALRAAERVVRQAFDADSTPLQAQTRRAMLDSMRAQAQDPANDPTVQYLILVRAARLAASLGDVNAVVWVSDVLAERYPHSSLSVRAGILQDAARSAAIMNARLALTDALLSVADEAAWAGNFAQAARFAQDARSLAGTERAGEKAHVFQEIVEGMAAQQRGELPYLSQGSTRYGILLCFGTGNTARGLPMLARGNDSLLAAVARIELDRRKQLMLRGLDAFLSALNVGLTPGSGAARAGVAMPDPLSAQQMRTLAGRYLQIARSRSYSPLARSGAAARAAQWYAGAIATAGGVERIALQRQLAEAGQLCVWAPRDDAIHALREAILSHDWTWPGEDVRMAFQPNGEVSHRGMHGVWQIVGPHEVLIRTDEGDPFRLHFDQTLTRYVGLGNDLRIDGARLAE